MIEMSELVRMAYKKLKSWVYFDKTQLPLRDKIVEFELDSYATEIRLTQLAEELEHYLSYGHIDFGTTDFVFEKSTQDILDRISLNILPKNLELKEDVSIYSNIPDAVKVKEMQYFIDLDVVGHILGFIWILLVGYSFDQEGYDNSFGNRLKKDFNGEPDYSPSLFASYFSQYESWRDEGLERAKKLLNNKKNVALFTLDFNKFYYSINLDRDVLFDEVQAKLKSTKNKWAKSLIIYLTDFVYEVSLKYSQLLREFDEQIVKERKILPIGFAPSLILSNLCLKKFDNSVIQGWNPSYYGRYVDDILIVDKVEKNSPVHQLMQDSAISKQKMIEHFLCHCDAWRRSAGVCKNNANNGLFIAAGERDSGEIQGEHTKNEYYVNDEFLTFPGCDIKLKDTKVKIYYFDSSQSDALVQCFQKNISRNISEFRYLPEDEPVFTANDYTEIYKLVGGTGSGSSPNKFNGIENIKLNKFQLSKFLGKYLRIGGLIQDNKEALFYKDIQKIFTKDVIIENYTAWEKVITILVINERYDELKNFIHSIFNAIQNLAESRHRSTMQVSLIKFFFAGLNRALALVWGQNINAWIIELQDMILKDSLPIMKEKLYAVDMMRKGYCCSRMVDKYSMPVPIDIVFDSSDKFKISEKDNIHFGALSSVMQYWEKNASRDPYASGYRYYPYTVTTMDLTISQMFRSMVKGNVKCMNFKASELKQKYCAVNYNSQEYQFQHCFWNDFKDNKQAYIKVGTSKADRIKVAVANTQLDDNNLINVLQNGIDRSYKRYEDFVNIVNSALQQKANILVLPEGYLPMDWLPIFARTCAKNQMAAVVGIEHFVLKDHVYNITATILPYIENNYKYAYIYFHNKTYYAPLETETIVSAGKKVALGNNYPLFCWNDFWFSTYCCYELSSIQDRSIFQSYADATIIVEWNADTNYYSNIVESLSRDLHCYCIQVNIAKYGDSRITQPAKTENKDLIRIKGGKNSTVLIEEIDIVGLRNFQLLGNIMQRKEAVYKVTPPGFDLNKVQLKKDGKLWDEIYKN